MVTKGIIVSIPIQPDDNKYRVRLPFFEDATEDAAEIVYDATLMEVPGIQQGYAVDDVVYCTFEDNDMGRPIIIGKLFVRDKENIGAEIETNNLVVNDRTRLSKRTSIGDATESDVANIKNIKNKVDKMGDTIFGALTLDNTINFTSGKDVNLLNAAGEVTQTITTNDLLAGGGGGSTKFIKGTPITLYDTDGTTPLHNLLPENILFYDGEQGSSDLFNYNSLNNKPSINGVTLVGNKTTDDLGIVSKFVKGTPINLYDTDGTTVLYSRNPENLVFYDGVGGEEISSNFIYGTNTTAITLSTTWQYAAIQNVASKGTGFEIEGGRIKCNKNGIVKVIAVGQFFRNSSSTTVAYHRIDINHTTIPNSTKYVNIGYSGQVVSQGVANVSEGDYIDIGVYSETANAVTYRTESTVFCEYIEDYYVTNAYEGVYGIVESGSNANGSYIKFADGTMVVWNYIEVTDQAISTFYTSGFYTGSRLMTFPQEFISIPTVNCSTFRWGTGASWPMVGNITLTNCSLYGIDTVSRATGTRTLIGYTAIGRWK